MSKDTTQTTTPTKEQEIERLKEYRNVFRSALTGIEYVLSGMVEGGWVIEGAWSPVCEPEYWCWSGLFSTDNLKATRFARKVDAESIAANMLDGMNVRVCFHEWG